MRTITKRLDCAPQTLVMVGDGPQDIEAGRSIGAFTLGVRGYLGH
jgi:phosphoglycolate phosphatase-like HAD superfamily hydrolase